MNNDADYFIDKFELIPENEWCTNFHAMDNRRDPLGHCGRRTGVFTAESDRLQNLDNEGRAILGTSITSANDGQAFRYNQDTPKQRTLAWLRDAKEAGL